MLQQTVLQFLKFEGRASVRPTLLAVRVLNDAAGYNCKSKLYITARVQKKYLALAYCSCSYKSDPFFSNNSYTAGSLDRHMLRHVQE